jgi:hypothetical protein
MPLKVLANYIVVKNGKSFGQSPNARPTLPAEIAERNPAECKQEIKEYISAIYWASTKT